VLVDPSVPDVDGIDLCRWLRTFPGAPIIALSTDASERAQLALFEAGVDDVVLKPISKRLLLARIRVQLRHERHRERAAGEVVTVGNLRIDTAALEAEVAGRRLLLSHRQFAMLRLLVHNVGSTVPSAMIARVLGRHDEGADPRTVRNAISKLRAALGHGPGTPEIVRQPTGGYRLLVP
jgi:two-component system, OmpR family, response regulator VicR